MSLSQNYPRGIAFLNLEHELRYLNHVHEWHGCRNCDLWCGRKQIVHYRGHIPCDILFIGEAPGESEDALGAPFVGEAGHVFDKLVLAAYDTFLNEIIPEPYSALCWGVTNINACIPREKSDTGTGKLRPPTREEAKACSPRLAKQIHLCSPQVVICLGQIPYRFLKLAKPHYELMQPEFKLYQFLHPSAINREENPHRKSLLEKRWVLQLSAILKELHSAYS